MDLQASDIFHAISYGLQTNENLTSKTTFPVLITQNVLQPRRKSANVEQGFTRLVLS